MNKDRFENKIVDLCFAPWSELHKELERLSLRTTLIEDGKTIIIDGAIRCPKGYRFAYGFSIHEDPQGKAIQISMAFCGLQATKYFPNLLAQVDRLDTPTAESLLDSSF